MTELVTVDMLKTQHLRCTTTPVASVHNEFPQIETGVQNTLGTCSKPDLPTLVMTHVPIVSRVYLLVACGLLVSAMSPMVKAK